MLKAKSIIFSMLPLLAWKAIFHAMADLIKAASPICCRRGCPQLM